MRQWKKILTRDANVLLKSLVIQSIAVGPRFVLPNWKGVHNHFWAWNKGETGIYYLKEEAARFSDAVLTATLQDPAWIVRYRTESRNRCDRAPAAIAALAHDVKSLSNTELCKRFEQFCARFSELAETIIITLEEVEEKILPHLRSPNDLAILTVPPELSIESQEELDRLDILKEIDTSYRTLFAHAAEEIPKRLKEFPALKRRIEEHMEQYGWIPLNFEKEIWDMPFFIGLLKKQFDEHDDYTKRIAELRAFSDEQKHKRDILLQSLDNQSRIIADLLEATAYIRLYRATMFSKAYYAAFPLLNEIGERLNITLDGLKQYTYQEIQDALANNTTLSEEQGKARKQSFAILILNDVYRQYEGKEAQNIIARETPQEQLVETKEMKGRCAYPGTVRGVVKIIADARDMDKIQPGDILVCKETNPDLVIAMARAGAIVTDEGGITSHAAIVSREMKKPCVIGTKVATRLLHDGDVVIVDAEKGIVTKE